MKQWQKWLLSPRASSQSEGYRALQVTCQRLEAWMSSCGEYHHGNALLNLFTAAPNLHVIKVHII